MLWAVATALICAGTAGAVITFALVVRDCVRRRRVTDAAIDSEAAWAAEINAELKQEAAATALEPQWLERVEADFMNWSTSVMAGIADWSSQELASADS